LNRQPLHSETGTPSLSPGSLGSSRTLSKGTLFVLEVEVEI
jgi:hypothetical protein